MTLPVRQQSKNATGVSASLSVVLTSAPTQGNLLVACVYANVAGSNDVTTG